MIKVNGPPKCGTHLLAKCVALFDYEPEGKWSHPVINCQVIHDPAHYGLLIIRNPRDMLVSRVRAFGRPILKEIYHALRESEGYRGECVVRFEDLLRGGISSVSEYLGKRPIPDHIRKMIGGTSTYTGKPSRWRDVWTDEIEAAWSPERETEWGYACHF